MGRGKEGALPDQSQGRLLMPASNWRQGRRKTELFLRGPIPLWWLDRAAHLPGRALHVGFLVWHRAAMVRGDEVAMSAEFYRTHGIALSSAKRALTALEGAGLVHVRRHHGRAPRVTLVKAKPTDPPS